MYKFNSLSLAIGMCLSISTPSLFAEEADNDDMKIVITGSHIKRIDQESSSPIAVITQVDIARSGATTLGELLQSTVYSNGSSLNNQQTGGFSVGASNYNLRGLRADRTLVLIDGKRLPSYPFAQNGNIAFTDLNIIPLAEIERVDILKDGASAVYGSDAIAGVVNVITRREFGGSEITLRTTAAESSDYSGNFVSFREGFSSAVTELTIIGEFQDYESLTGKSSDQTNALDESEVSSFSFPGTYFTLDQNNELVGNAAPGCDRIVDSSPLGVPGTACGFDWAADRQLLPENRRVGLSIKMTQYFGDTSLFIDVAGNQTETQSDVPFGLVGDDFLILDTSTFNPIGETMLFRRGFSEIGLQNINTEANNIRALFGLEGLVSNFDYELSLAYGRTEVDEVFNKGWMSVTDQDALFAAIDNEEINPFDRLTAQQIEQYTSKFASKGKSYQAQFAANLSGEIMQLDAGSVFMATGLEYRREYVLSDSDQEILDGDVVGLGSAFAEGDRNIGAVFAEFIIPTSKSLESNIALRYDDYSDFGSVFNPKFSIRYSATDSLVFRGSWGTGFRAPNLFELNSGDVVGSVGSISVISTGNLDLKAEESESINLGIVFDYNEQVMMSLDLWEIEVEDMITNLGVFNIFTQTDEDDNLIYEDLITYNTDGSIAFVTDPYLNIDQQYTRGVDLNARWSIIDNLIWSMTATHLNKIEQSTASSDGSIELAGEYLFPRNRVNTNLVFNHGNVRHALSAYHIISHGTGEDVVDAYTKWDYQLGYQWNNHTLTITVDNLLDEEAPSNRPSDWPYYEQRMYSPLERNYSLQWKYTY